ncbi:MAG: selenocysteine-specific elongation factor, partial [Frankiaceae bacterium]|nr:selenocysteine-specific elongation factor [Frankiaceae bacterium]
MDVIATAGHVDHGKSTLVRALTGMEPDRWAEERRRGMTIDLGFAWTTLPTGRTIAFVDVPGHQRFVANMLAGAGPVPAVLFVVAADEGWSRQSADHLAALDALGVRAGLIAVTKSDLADPSAAAAQAVAELASTSLGHCRAVPVSAVTGSGLDELRDALDELARRLPEPRAHDRVRLWIDRSFTIRGSGTVVTGTLCAGALTAGDELTVSGADVAARVRGLHSLGEPVDGATAVARVAVNLRGIDASALSRGQALLTPGAWLAVPTVDVRLHAAGELPQHLVAHIGSAAVPVHVRPLGARFARLHLAQALPLMVGDRLVLRDPGVHRVVGGAEVMDVVVPAFTRRGAAVARATSLLETLEDPSAAGEVRRRRAVRRETLEQAGVPLPPAGGPPDGTVEAGGWWVADDEWARWQADLRAAVVRQAQDAPLHPGLARTAATRAAGVPDDALLDPLVASCPDLALDGHGVHAAQAKPVLPDDVAAAVGAVAARLATAPFAAPEATDLSAAGLGASELAALTRAGA